MTGTDRIDELRSLITDILPVNKTQYPALYGQEHAFAFCVKHSALHYSKTSGQLAALAEALDHGHCPDLSEATKIVANSLVNALKLAEELAIPTETIVEFIRHKYQRS